MARNTQTHIRSDSLQPDSTRVTIVPEFTEDARKTRFKTDRCEENKTEDAKKICFKIKCAKELRFKTENAKKMCFETEDEKKMRLRQKMR